MTLRNTQTALLLAACCALSIPSIHAGQTVETPAKPTPVVETKDVCKSIFAIPTLYHNKENPYVQKFAINGRYQGQYHWLDSNRGNANAWDNRRVYIGVAGQFFQKLDADVQFKLNVDEGPLVEGFELFTLAWTESKEFKITIGKFQAPVTEEYRTSSSRIITFERSLLVNQVVPDKIGGLAASGEIQGWLYDAGIYTGSEDEDFLTPSFDGGVLLQASLGRKWEDVGLFRLDYLWTSNNDGNNMAKPYTSVFALNYTGKFGKFGILTEAIAGFGQDATSNAWGIVIMPSWNFTEKLQLVTRYQFANADSSSGLTLQKRYERTAPDLITTKGDQYNALYAGLNYYICGNNLKLMAGAEWSAMDQQGGNYHGVTWLTGVRLNF